MLSQQAMSDILISILCIVAILLFMQMLMAGKWIYKMATKSQNATANAAAPYYHPLSSAYAYR
jgi:hypothetical protein